jgi:hypothetical protein
MKKALVFALFMFVASSAKASGKMSYQAHTNDQGVTVGHMIGLAVYERMNKRMAFNSWTGWGSQPLDTTDDVMWVQTKNQIDFNFAKFTVSPGIRLAYVKPYDDMLVGGYVKFDYTLW